MELPKNKLKKIQNSESLRLKSLDEKVSFDEKLRSNKKSIYKNINEIKRYINEIEKYVNDMKENANKIIEEIRCVEDISKSISKIMKYVIYIGVDEKKIGGYLYDIDKDVDYIYRSAHNIFMNMNDE